MSHPEQPAINIYIGEKKGMAFIPYLLEKKGRGKHN
jgi:hypothetical protein